MSQRRSEFLDLRRRTVHLEPRQVRDLERFREQCANVLQMSEQPLRIRIAFATKNFITVDGEPIEKILFFARSLLNERREPGFERLHFSRMNFEVRMQTDEIRKRFHVVIL